jgi:Phytanoyl-CoA dioxygenase (PhyH)
MNTLLDFIFDILSYKRDKFYAVKPSTFQIMRRLDVLTLGLSSWCLEFMIEGGKIKANDVISYRLRDVGFVKLNKVDSYSIRDILSFDVYARAGKKIRGNIDLVEPIVKDEIGRLEIDDQSLFSSKQIVSFLLKSNFLDIAKKHFGRNVACVRVSGWWSFPTKSKSNFDGSAQKFHRDIDWLKELKFFVFMTDVNSENGPFDFIKYTHRKRLDRFIFTDRRYDEDEIFNAYPPDKFMESAICDRGEIFVVDTRGYHRGRPVKKGRRCVFCVEFSVNCFGAESQNRPRIKLDPKWESYRMWVDALKDESAWATLFDIDELAKKNLQ